MPEALSYDDSFKPPGSPSHTRRASLKVLSRNIDQVVLGNLLFDTWYFSPYPEGVVFGEHHHAKSTLNGESKNGHVEKPAIPAIPKLHVCPYCFKYTTESSDYVAHLQFHTSEANQDPEAWRPVPKSAVKVYEWEGYTVWDIDGEQEKLYCQNLSLFAKLFLEQKSVFFDTSGFHYFVLAYHADAQPESPTAGKGRTRRRKSSTVSAPGTNLKTQVLGFFSKENLSWDSNNLACILVFPPFQHRNLGQLLMAVSYKLSGWEWEDSIIGGPEKPLSTLGRKSYLRFWSERIARFFMGQTADAEGEVLFSQPTKKRTTHAKEEMTVKEVGSRTGMLPEDVIAALNEMGICEPGPAKKKKPLDENNASDVIEESTSITMIVKRSKILAWAERNRVDLAGPVKEEGFLGEWALSESNDTSSTNSSTKREACDE